jgi:hypothetical protein
VVLGKYAGVVVVGKAMATPASLNIHSEECVLGKCMLWFWGEVCRLRGVWVLGK